MPIFVNVLSVAYPVLADCVGLDDPVAGRLRGWRSPLTRFSLLTVLRREHSSLLALVASLTALKVVSDHAVTGRLTLGPRWGTALAATLLVCLAIRTLKHRTRLLHVEGR